jgi:S1-C subfamily serine protease
MIKIALVNQNQLVGYLFFICLFFLSGCAALYELGLLPSTSERCKQYYNTVPSQKALAIAEDSNGHWACGYSYGQATTEQAIAVAYSRCINSRAQYGVYSNCRLYAVNDKVVYYDSAGYGTQESPGYETVKPPGAEEYVGYGTGFAIREDGLILTAYHVVENARSITVHLADGNSVEAKLEKFSKSIDLALLKINENLTNYLELAELGSIQIGDPVFTIGFPVVSVLGKEPKFTDGTISSLSGIGDEAAYIQISVPVQPGNSGGPLVNEQGKVVAIITSRAADIPFFAKTGSLPQNINWAINADFARPLFKQSSKKKTIPANRIEAIGRVEKAICRIEAIK